MNARISALTPLSRIGALLGCGLLLAACMGQGDNSVSVDAGAEAVLTGQIAGSSAEAAFVTTQEVDASGAVGAVVDTCHASADGSFRLKTSLRGERALLVRVVRGGKEWKARFEDRIESGSEKALGVIDAQSSVDAETWLELRLTAEGRAVLAADLRAALRAYADSAGSAAFAAYDAGDSARRELVVRLALAARARAIARVHAIDSLIARVRAADSTFDTAHVVLRADLTPCERAAFLIAAMNPDHPDYAVLRARLAANCLDNDTVPPTPAVCREMTARLDGLAETAPVALGLRLQIAAYCTAQVPPPQPLTRCERAAVRLTLMDPHRPSAAVLRVLFRRHCLDADTTDDAGVDSGASASL